VIVVGPPPIATAAATELQAQRPGAFDVTIVAAGPEDRLASSPAEAAADRALRDREAYGAFILTGSGPTLHLASAASPAVASLLTQASQALALKINHSITVVDVVPGSAGDPRGAGFAAGFLPLVLMSVIAGVVMFVLIVGWRPRLVALAAYAVLAGLVGATVLQGLGVTSGGYLANAGAIGLLALAVSATIAGLGALLGPVGIALGWRCSSYWPTRSRGSPPRPNCSPHPGERSGSTCRRGPGPACCARPPSSTAPAPLLHCGLSRPGPRSGSSSR
jgi:hypothetical protein